MLFLLSSGLRPAKGAKKARYNSNKGLRPAECFFAIFGLTPELHIAFSLSPGNSPTKGAKKAICNSNKGLRPMKIMSRHLRANALQTM